MLPDPVSPDAVAHEVNVIPMHFRVDYIPDRDRPGEFREIHKVDLVKKGSNGESTPWSIPALKKEQFLWPHVEKYYDHWLAGQEDPVEGTPLDVLPFLPPPIVGHLKNIHIRTAEDLAATTDGDLERIGMGARGWREKARSFIEAKEGTALIAAVNADLKLENEQLRADVDEMKAQLNVLTADRPKRSKPKDVAK